MLQPPASDLSSRASAPAEPAPLSRAVRARRWAGEYAPGLLLAAAVVTAILLFTSRYSVISPLLAAILVGAIAANVVDIPQRLRPGLQFCAKRLLRIGVALLGVQVTFTDILGLGPATLVAVLVVVVGGIGGTMVLGRALGIGWTQRLLIACGFSICGAAAVAAADGVVDADEEEVLTSIALVVVFGTLLIAILPPAAHVLGLDAATSGVWAGAAVHEVAQVVAVGGALGGTALTVAVVVKLARVVLLAPVLAAVSWHMRRGRTDETVDAGHRPPLVPMFVLAFLACAAVRSTGVIPAGLLEMARDAQTLLLTAAMFALGTGVKVRSLARIGPRPILLAAGSTVWVSSLALAGALIATH
ncbi:membrane protein [Nocardia neocaledoniensis NBRC 108232]|uniref:Putative integral membrane protein (TIGR00698 family) n=1 Tax=Nocardia neocaledoniensis TaxID=236511 RepID=A0A317P2D4_9NOCA|nr:putative sulfate exporter family transporter [Nocardia neocaledoniensis]PWV81531.1 putative integral membrane protein (TIGR00698 family) [Nocardia neocaledoniensis]GEM32145.1 membrane protein [Nocardia neocaledoniensis NBRC 108232]